MADDLDWNLDDLPDIPPDLRSDRDKILDRCRLGKLNDEQAEREAEAKGLPPLSGRPDTSVCDPMKLVNWTPLMAVAWIAYRDLQMVRDVTTEFRNQWTEWHKRPVRIKQAQPKGHPGPTVFDRYESHFIRPLTKVGYTYLMEHESSVGGSNVESNPRSAEYKVSTARTKLLATLQSGHLSATGKKGRMANTVGIPSIEWGGLYLSSHSPDDALAGDVTVYSEVSVPREEILQQFPVLKPEELPKSFLSRCWTLQQALSWIRYRNTHLLNEYNTYRMYLIATDPEVHRNDASLSPVEPNCERVLFEDLRDGRVRANIDGISTAVSQWSIFPLRIAWTKYRCNRSDILAKWPPSERSEEIKAGPKRKWSEKELVDVADEINARLKGSDRTLEKAYALLIGQTHISDGRARKLFKGRMDPGKRGRKSKSEQGEIPMK